MGAATGVSRPRIAHPCAAGLHCFRHSDVRLLAKAAHLRALAGGSHERCRRPRCRDVARHHTVGSYRSLHGGNVSEDPRGGYPASTARDDGVVDPGGAVVGKHPRAAPHWHARQRADPGGDGEPVAEDRRDGCLDRHHRHHRGPDRRHPGGATPAEDSGGRPPHGGRLHHQRYPSADRADYRAPGRQPVGRDDEGISFRCVRDRSEAHPGQAAGAGGGKSP